MRALRPGHVPGHEVHRGGDLLVGVVGGGTASGGACDFDYWGKWYILRVVLQNTMRGTWRSWQRPKR